MHDAKYVNHPILSERSGDKSHVGSSLELLFGSDLQWPPTGYLDDPGRVGAFGLLPISQRTSPPLPQPTEQAGRGCYPEAASAPSGCT